MSETVYVGNGKVKTGSRGSWLSILFTKSDVEELFARLDNGFVRVNVNKRKKPSEKGYTHSVTVDTWKPSNTIEAPPPEEDDNLPF